jgi:hypothetical protein
MELERTNIQPRDELVCALFYKEEKEMAEEEEVDKLILNSLCSDIMDEVMDLGNADPTDHKTASRNKSPSSSTKYAKRSKRNKNNKIVPNERYLLEF